ncbi:hypothetical protein VTK73DRAFT_10323 [Phialemonium thermophilum]|uniref:Amino acid transporter transmembrane domain-containing protein n=1 Tax=Phialemonium thermophilum TaxID=223376 RepID=A0ABR3XH67_9PEZI
MAREATKSLHVRGVTTKRLDASIPPKQPPKSEPRDTTRQQRKDSFSRVQLSHLGLAVVPIGVGAESSLSVFGVVTLGGVSRGLNWVGMDHPS